VDAVSPLGSGVEGVWSSQSGGWGVVFALGVSPDGSQHASELSSSVFLRGLASGSKGVQVVAFALISSTISWWIGWPLLL